MEPIITRHIGTPELWRLDTYRAHGGYETLARALREHQPDDLVTMVRDAGLRGRGGAGFPTGVKWGFLPKDGRPRYLICNGDESEPGTFKDRLLLENDPHQMLEGLILSCYAVGRIWLSFTCGANFFSALTVSRTPSTRPTRRATSARTSSAPA